MADTLKNSFVESNNHTKVVFQRGRDLLDFELNEMQDNLRVGTYRALWAGLQDAADPTPGVVSYPAANDSSWQCLENTGDTSNKVLINSRASLTSPCSGYAFCDGVAIYLGTDIVLDTFTSNTDVAARYDYLWLVLSESEIADPAQVPQLGETTRRQQLTYSWFVDEGVPGAPAAPVDPGSTNPITAPIWDGGVRYFLVATILRPAGSSDILTAHITDNRSLMIGYIVNHTTRQSNFAVQALVASKIETSDGLGPVPTSPTMTFHVDPGDDHAAVAKQFFWHAGSGPSVTATLSDYVGMGVPTITGLNGTLLLKAGMALGVASGDTRFWDGNTSASYGGTAGKNRYVSLTSSGHGSLNIWATRGAYGTTYPDPSIIQKLNSKPYVTVSASGYSNGDFSTIAEAVSFLSTYGSALPLSVIDECHLILRPGVHYISTDVTWKGALIIESETPGGAQIVLNAVCTLAADYGLDLRDIDVYNTGGGQISVGNNVSGLAPAPENNALVRFRDCRFDSAYTLTRDLFRIGTLIDNDPKTNNFPAFFAERCNFVNGHCGVLLNFCATDGGTHNGFIFNDCKFESKDAGCVSFSVSTPTCTYSGVSFNRCKFVLEKMTYTPTNYATSDYNSGLVYTDYTTDIAGSVRIEDISYNDCDISVGSYSPTANCGSLWLLWFESSGAATTVVENLSFNRCKFHYVNGSGNYGPPFVIASPTTWGSTSGFYNFGMDNCTFYISATSTIATIVPTSLSHIYTSLGTVKVLAAMSPDVSMTNNKFLKVRYNDGAGVCSLYGTRLYLTNNVVDFGGSSAGVPYSHHFHISFDEELVLDGNVSNDPSNLVDYNVYILPKAEYCTIDLRNNRLSGAENGVYVYSSGSHDYANVKILGNSIKRAPGLTNPAVTVNMSDAISNIVISNNEFGGGISVVGDSISSAVISSNYLNALSSVDGISVYSTSSMRYSICNNSTFGFSGYGILCVCGAGTAETDLVGSAVGNTVMQDSSTVGSIKAAFNLTSPITSVYHYLHVGYSNAIAAGIADQFDDGFKTLMNVAELSNA